MGGSRTRPYGLGEAGSDTVFSSVGARRAVPLLAARRAEFYLAGAVGDLQHDAAGGDPAKAHERSKASRKRDLRRRGPAGQRHAVSWDDRGVDRVTGQAGRQVDRVPACSE